MKKVLPHIESTTESPTGSFAVSLFRRYEWLFVVAVGLVVLIPGLGAADLVDPWETHYGEVARRILEEKDWVFLRWQDESFRSKPVLTFWLMAASLSLFGIGNGGGYSGELVHSHWTEFALRLPFACFSILGLFMVWLMLKRLHSSRLAWIAFFVLLTTPFYALVSRHAITDMPMVACVMAGISCFALAVLEPERPLHRIWRGFNALHLAMGVVSVLVAGQAFYYIFYFLKFPALAYGVRVPLPGFVLGGLLLAGLAFLWFAALRWRPVSKMRSVYMLWFYVFCSVSVLAKGPPGLALMGLVPLLFIVATWDWRLVLKVEILRGSLVAALIGVPWHLAMFFKDGIGFGNEYFGIHWFQRVGFHKSAAHGPQGTFDFLVTQLGIGMWPWIALAPVGLALLVATQSFNTKEGKLRLIVVCWAIASFSLFAISRTKFHHYILPAVVPMAICVAYWLHRLLGRKKNNILPALVIGLCLLALIARDLIVENKQIIELFIYRYDRPWPSGEPWLIDLGPIFQKFALAFGALLALLWVPRTRGLVAGGLFSVALIYSLWLTQDYMNTATPHWGQRTLHQVYYDNRNIYGIDIKYTSLGDLAHDWDSADSVTLKHTYWVRSVVPHTLSVGDHSKVVLHLPGTGVPNGRLTLNGKISAIGDHGFEIAIPAGEMKDLSPLLDRAKGKARSKEGPWSQVNADRLISWQLNWRGENFWSGGEIFGQIPDTRSVFNETKNDAFLKYLKLPEHKGRSFYLITESGRASGLRNVLPSPRAKESMRIIDTSSNKFSLVHFRL